MRQVLMIAYYFPPFGGAGVQRTLKFVKYLPELGWRPIVLTIHPRRNDLLDPSLLQEIPSDAKVIHSRTIRIPTWLPWRARNLITRWFLLVDEQVGWLPFASSHAIRLINQDHIHALYTTSSPYTDHLIGYQIKKRINIPWVADFRDPWTDNFTLHYPTTIHRKLNDIMESKVFHAADQVILNTDMSYQFYRRKYPDIKTDHFVTIPNGYDPSDFTDIIPIHKDTSIFSIVHIGSLYRKSRSGINFLEVIKWLKHSGFFTTAHLKVGFIGTVDQETHKFVSLNHLEDIIQFMGYVPHKESITHMLTADLLLYIPYKGIGSDLLIPAKLYEYIATGKTMLCLSAPGAVTRLLEDHQVGIIVDPNDIAAIGQSIVSLYRHWQDGQLKIYPNPEFLTHFDRRSLTADLAKVLDRISTTG